MNLLAMDPTWRANRNNVEFTNAQVRTKLSKAQYNQYAAETELRAIERQIQKHVGGVTTFKGARHSK